MFQVLYIETGEREDYIVFDPRWLCTNVLGEILSHQKIMQVRVTGCFTEHDFNLLYPEAEATDTLRVLEALELCTACDNDGETEYEFPALNFVERLPGLWDGDDSGDGLTYAGVRLKVYTGVADSAHQLVHCFCRVQAQLRRSVPMTAAGTDPDTDLYQWYHGSKFCSGHLECIVTLEDHDQVVEIKGRGPRGERKSLFFFFTDIVSLVEGTISDVCPSLTLTRDYLSAKHLANSRSADDVIDCFAAKDIVNMQIQGRCELPLSDSDMESTRDLICMGCEDIHSRLQLGIALHISYLKPETCRLLCRLLDPPDAMGKDWCLLALQLGLQDKLPKLDPVSNQISSPTMKILTYLGKTDCNTVGTLMSKLSDLGREDARSAIMSTMLLYKCDKSTTGNTSGSGKSEKVTDTAVATKSQDKATSPDLDLEFSSASR